MGHLAGQKLTPSRPCPPRARKLQSPPRNRKGATHLIELVFCFGVRAESELAKRGTYHPHFWWKEAGKWFELIRPVALAAFVGLVAGCTHAIPLKATVEGPNTVTQIPLAVGVFYSREFREYIHSGSRGGDRWEFPLGSASVKLFDQALSMMFERVVPVSSRPPLAAGGPALAAVIEPKVEEFDFTIPFLKTSTFTAEIAYRVTLYSPQGDPFASWVVRGAGAKPGEVGFEFARWPGEAADLAMQDAARKFISGLGDVPEVRRWFRQAGVRGAAGFPALIRSLFRRG